MKFSPLQSVWLSICLLILILPASVSAEPAAANLNRLLTAYTKPVFDMLSHIHAHEITQHARFLILSSRSNPQYYVQCLFYDKDTKIFCEAASGFYSEPQYHLSAKGRNAIRNMGFRVDDSTRNYPHVDIDVTGPETLWTVSGMMLETLYRGYGVRPGEVMLCDPFDLKTNKCDGRGMWYFPRALMEIGIEEKVDRELGFKLVHLAQGANHGALDGGSPDDIIPFLIYQELGKYEGTVDWLAVNPWTGDVWDVDAGPDCIRLTSPALLKEQEQIKKRFSPAELKEYSRLSELMPIRIPLLEPCGSPEEK